MFRYYYSHIDGMDSTCQLSQAHNAFICSLFSRSFAAVFLINVLYKFISYQMNVVRQAVAQRIQFYFYLCRSFSVLLGCSRDHLLYRSHTLLIIILECNRDFIIYCIDSESDKLAAYISIVAAKVKRERKSETPPCESKWRCFSFMLSFCSQRLDCALYNFIFDSTRRIPSHVTIGSQCCVAPSMFCEFESIEV